MRFAFVLFGLAVGNILPAQCPLVDFNIPANGCIDQRLYINNLSDPADNYTWDFCSGDLQVTPTPTAVATSSSIFRARVFRTVQSEAGEWFGFAIDQPNNALVRFNFGNNLNNTPTLTSLGNPGSKLNSSLDMQLTNENGSWYALVVNTGGNNLLRLNFGTSLTTTPSVTDLGSFSGALKSPGGIFLVKDGNTHYAFIANGSVAEIVALNFGNSILNTPTVSSFSVTGASGLRSLSIIRECDRWFGLVTSYNNSSVYYLDFQSGLSQPSDVGLLSIPGASYSFPASLAIANEAGEFYAFIQSAFPGHLYRISFGISIVDRTGTFTNLGNLGISNDNSALEIISSGTEWKAFTIDLSGVVTPGSGRLMRLSFGQPCTASGFVFNGVTPPAVTYSGAGTYRISLTSVTNQGTISHSFKTITINSAQSPDISFTSQNICVNHDMNFTAQNNSGNIVSYDWNFGDASSSSLANPTHQYGDTGAYSVTLNVTASNGCLNSFKQPISIYNEPVADFLLPSASPLCTNQSYFFENNSTFDPGSLPAWEWKVNGTSVSLNEDMNHSFTTTTSQEIRLKASIPGCESEAVKVIGSVTEGPDVDFTFAGQCEDDPLQFTNSTTGNVSSYSWDFGDTETSSALNPAHVYINPGQYTVLVMATNAAGCTNSKSKTVGVYSKPQSNFSIPLPPFSCNGSPTQFTDLTPNPFDSNLTSWLWDFNDGAATSTNRNPQYTYTNASDYLVSLTATTNFGCSTQFQKTITIASSPTADFTNSAPCVGVPVNFTDTSTGTLQSRQWQIENAQFTSQNPVYTFNTSGNKSINLIVTATNGCVGNKLKTVTVPVILTPDFSFTKNCVDQQTEFSDLTNAASDPVTARQWTFTGLGTGTNNPQLFTFSTTGNYNVKIALTTQSGCMYSTQKNVVILNAPQANFTTNPEFGEPPLPVQFTNTSTHASSYLWQFNDPGNSSSAQASPVFTFTAFGEYAVNLTARTAQGCIGTISKIVRVVIPFYDIGVTQLELITNLNGSIRPATTIHNRSNVPITNLPIRFNLSGGSNIREYVSASIQPGETYRHSVTFEVPVTPLLKFICAEAEISDASPDDNTQCASLEQKNVALEPYPNPVFGKSDVRLEWIVDQPGKTNIIIINTAGQIVMNTQVDSLPGYNTITFPTAGLHAGLYLVQLDHGNLKSAYRVVIAE